MNFEYPANIEKGADKRYFVSFIDFEEAVTEGETLEEALFNASEVLNLTIEGRFDEKLNIPSPSRLRSNRNVYYIAPAARVQAALLFKFARKNRSVADIARALGTSWPAVSRLEDPHHTPSLRQLEKVASALGKRLIINFD